MDILKSIAEYINIILIITSIIVSMISIIFKIKSNIVEFVSAYIAMAEGKVELTGSEKMDLVINWLRQLVPKIFKVVFSDKVLRMIAQNIFDDMKLYSDTYIENKKK